MVRVKPAKHMTLFHFFLWCSSKYLIILIALVLFVQMISERIYLKLSVACIVKWVGTIEHKHFSKSMFSGWQFQITSTFTKRKEILVANTVSKRQNLQENPSYKHGLYALHGSRLSTSDWACCINESARGDCVKGYPIAYTACWLKHRRCIVCVQSTWQDTNNPKVISPLTADFKWSRSYQSSQMEINFVSEC